MASNHKQRLSRLEPGNYRGTAWVHWNLAIEDRKTGWLNNPFYYKFRELLAHVSFRSQLATPIFCLMPDHIHLLWCGLADNSDQLIAMRRLRKDLNDCLQRINLQLQFQSYDHVLKDHELEQVALENTMDYIARNPERKKLVNEDDFAKYYYTSCLLPGYPQMRLFTSDGWDRIWRTLASLKRTECFHLPDPKYQS